MTMDQALLRFCSDSSQLEGQPAGRPAMLEAHVCTKRNSTL
jgi:hypothetical protein